MNEDDTEVKIESIQINLSDIRHLKDKTFQMDETECNDEIQNPNHGESGGIVNFKEKQRKKPPADENYMVHLIMVGNKWSDFYPTEVKNQFIKHLIEKMIQKTGGFSILKQRLEFQLKSNHPISHCKFDEAFIQLFLLELSNTDIAEDDSSSFKNMIEEYFVIAASDFDRISDDFKKFVHSCLLYLVENTQYQPNCLNHLLNWYFFKIVHDFDFIKHEWVKWKKEMEKPFDDKIKININEALVQACKLGKQEMVLLFLIMLTISCLLINML